MISKGIGIIRLFGEFNSVKIDRSIYENILKINHWKREKLVYRMKFNMDREITKKIYFKHTIFIKIFVRYKVEFILIQFNPI